MVRVIAGKYKHQRLATLKGLETRPSSDRLKEALFNLLREEVEESYFLDCFSGCGSVGIEALSRGARGSHPDRVRAAGGAGDSAQPEVPLP